MGRIHLKNNYTVICLFAGAGGFLEGFIKPGCEPVAHVEISGAACYCLEA